VEIIGDKMAYTAVVTKQSVAKSNNHIYNITIEMIVSDEVEEVFRSSASIRYDDRSPNVGGLEDGLIAQLKEDWDEYAEEHGIFTATALDTVVGSIQTKTNLYINL
jgi:hypothetical protein